LKKVLTMRFMTLALLISAALSSGCTVLAVTGAVVGTAATAVSTGVDVAVGTAKVGAKVVGAAVDVVIPDADSAKK
jgi:hypothetical protein